METETAPPVMDVSAPPASGPAPQHTPKAAGPTLATPPPEAKPIDKPHPTHAPASKPEPKEAAKAKVNSKVQTPPKDNSNVTTAIVATVFIVLGLAGLATYAYLKQNS